MRKLIVFICLTSLVLSVIAQAPQGISHQLVIRNNFNRLVTNAPVGIKVSILQGSEVGPVIYSETHSLISNTNGMVSFTIGQGSVLNGVFANINWASGSYFIKTEADPAGSNNYSISGTSQALSVPYALHANTAQSITTPITETDPVFGGSPAKNITSDQITNWNTAFLWGDHASADYVGSSRTLSINGISQNLSANRTWNVGTVTSIGLALPNIFSVSGTPVTGSGTISANLASQNANLVLASPNETTGTPSFRALLASDIPNLDWSKITTGKPTTISGYGITDAVSTSGNQTINGTKTFSSTIAADAGLNAGSSRITNMANPVNNQDAVTKAYFDNIIGQISETDPVFGVSAASTITSGQITNWNTAFLWGDHASADYVGSSRTLTINGISQNLSANRTWNVGTVTSIGLALPNIFSVSGTPVTGSGTISANLVTQNANLVLASPNGTTGTPSFRALLASDIPNLDWSKITTGKPTTITGYGITDAVRTSGNQTVGGTKTFTSIVVANSGMNAGTSRITNLADPVDAQDAVTKSYLDTSIGLITESDPLFMASAASSIIPGDIVNWNTAFGWGNHSSAGYVVGSTRTLTINGVAQNLSANRTWNVGTVTSIGLALPNIFSVSGTPVTGSGTISANLVTQNANLVLASPNGTTGTPSFRALLASDIPNLDWSKITTGKPTTITGYGITDAVRTSGNQTVGGTKTFTSIVVANSGMNAGTSRITNLADPVDAQDAVTKSYFDNIIGQISETDPVFGVSAASTITSGQITNWNTAFLWGDHASADYVGSSRTLTINGISQNLSANRTWNVGTVTSIGLALPNIFSVSGTPVTGSGTISANLVTQNANLVLASPNGTTGTPSFRALLASDIPDLNWSKITTGKPTTTSGYGITDAVTTSGNQTIGGTKSFSSAIVADAGVNAGNSRITNMANPVNNQDAVTKAYFDSNKIQNGTSAGQMLYWNGTDWMVIPPGTNGQSLVYCNGVPSWGGCIPEVATSEITNNTGITATGGGNVLQDGGQPVTQRGVCWGLTQNPTITNNVGMTIDGAGVGTFTSSLTGLSVLTTYYVRAYAINEIGVSYGDQVQFTTPEWTCGLSAIGDADGNVYNTVVIGTQCWMSQNLNIGQQVSVVPSDNGIIEKYCMQNLSTNCDEYGALYSWNELMNYTTSEGTQGICPTGWHIPAKAEFEALTTLLGGTTVAGGKMKEIGNIHWNSNVGATNESGFTAYGGGYYNSLFIGFKSTANFATSTGSGSDFFHTRLYNSSATHDLLTISKAAFVSVRCVKD